jgi:hypothetical protein
MPRVRIPLAPLAAVVFNGIALQASNLAVSVRIRVAAPLKPLPLVPIMYTDGRPNEGRDMEAPEGYQPTAPYKVGDPDDQGWRTLVPRNPVAREVIAEVMGVTDPDVQTFDVHEGEYVQIMALCIVRYVDRTS